MTAIDSRIVDVLGHLSIDLSIILWGFYHVFVLYPMLCSRISCARVRNFENVIWSVTMYSKSWIVKKCKNNKPCFHYFALNYNICDAQEMVLPHWGWVTHIYVGKLTNHWLRWWLVAWPAPSHYLNQCWNIVNWSLRNKLQWNSNRCSNIFIEENTFENVVCEMLSISSRPQCVKVMMSYSLLPSGAI